MRMLYAPNVPNPVCLIAGSDFAFADLIAPALADARAGMTRPLRSRSASPGCAFRSPRRRPPRTGPASTRVRTSWSTGSGAGGGKWRWPPRSRPRTRVGTALREAEADAGSAEHLAEPSRVGRLCHGAFRRTRPCLRN